MTTANPKMPDNVASDKRRPPKPPLAFRVGITGHRPEPDNLSAAERKRPIPDIPVIQNTIREVLEVIRLAIKGVAETRGDLFEIEPGTFPQTGGAIIRVVSALASGSDQWAAEVAFKLGYELHAIIPFSKDEYREDFKETGDEDAFDKLLGLATAVLELDGKIESDKELKLRKPDSHSYEAVGRALLNQTDLLIAVWDGKDSQGKGGTGYVVNEALQMRIPVVFIPWKPIDKIQLQLPPWRIMEETADLQGNSDRLSELIVQMLLPPEEARSSEDETGCSLRNMYFNEEQKTGNPQHGMWMMFRTIVCGELFKPGGWSKIVNGFQVSDFVKQENVNARKFWNHWKGEPPVYGAPIIDPRLQDWISDRYNAHYAWANELSMYYGNLHRSAFVLNYLLGALAVFLALICIALSITGRDQSGWIIAELIVIIGILSLTATGRNSKWHQRWIDYRTLAEWLRLSRCLILFGGGTKQLVYEGHLSSYGNPTHTWMYWHYHAIERAAGIPPVSFSGTYLQSCQELWRDRLILGQIDYHRSNFVRLKKMDNRLHKSGEHLFILTLIACLLHLLHVWVENHPKFDWIPHPIGGLMVLFCAFLPALGAAYAAIRSHGELQRLAQRSKAMEETLIKMQTEFAQIDAAGKSLNSTMLRYHADRISDLMTNEMLDWRVVFQDRPLGLPA